ncbi:MAG TPA: amidohydrolase family protein [Pseudonocardia sp.]|jgi:hypothetical protein
MIGDWVIADAVIHGFNLSRPNWNSPETENLVLGQGRANAVRSEEAATLGPGARTRNWLAEDLEDVVFLESPIDVAAYHGVPMWYHFKDGVSDFRKGLVLRERHPERVLVYGPLDPTQGKKALDDMERLVGEFQVDGIKVYGASYRPDGTVLPVQLNDPKIGYPFIEKAIELGVKVIAAHKMLPPIGPFAAFGVSDIPNPAGLYPEMQFEIVHAGMAFVEDTAMMAFHKNIWFTMESTAVFAQKMPRRFAQFVGALLANGGGDRLMFASGTTLQHPRPLIDAFLDFEMPEDLMVDYGYPAFDEQTKRNVLGENLLRLHGLDREKVVAAVSNDDLARRRAEIGRVEPWSQVRARLGPEAGI